MTDWKARLSAQDAYEAEGAAQGLLGKTREDCPYNKETQSDAWNFWVYGCERAAGEKQMLESGTITFGSTAIDGPNFSIPAREAIETGMWKPKWITARSS